MCGSLHKISEKSYQCKDGTWDIPSRSVEKNNFHGDPLRGVERKIALKFENALGAFNNYVDTMRGGGGGADYCQT